MSLGNMIYHDLFSGHNNSHLSHIQNILNPSVKVPESYPTTASFWKPRTLVSKSSPGADEAQLFENSSLKLLLSARSPMKTYELKRQGISFRHHHHLHNQHSTVRLAWGNHDRLSFKKRRNGSTRYSLVRSSSEIQPGTHCRVLD